MLLDLYQSLHHFKGEFSRQQAWLLFCAIILSFLGATEMRGVTSMCRYWLSDERATIGCSIFFVPGLIIQSGYGLAGIGSCCPMRHWWRWRGVWCCWATIPTWARMADGCREWFRYGKPQKSKASRTISGDSVGVRRVCWWERCPPVSAYR